MTSFSEKLGDSLKPSNYSQTKEETNKLLEDRKEVYGDAEQCHKSIGMAWSALLDIEPIPSYKVALMMSAFKIIRMKYRYKEDNYIDANNYLGFAKIWQKPKEYTCKTCGLKFTENEKQLIVNGVCLRCKQLIDVKDICGKCGRGVKGETVYEPQDGLILCQGCFKVWLDRNTIK